MCAPTWKFQYVSILTIRRHFQTNTRPSPQRKICTKFSGRMWCNKINFVQYNTIKVKFSPKQELKRLSSTDVSRLLFQCLCRPQKVKNCVPCYSSSTRQLIRKHIKFSDFITKHHFAQGIGTSVFNVYEVESQVLHFKPIMTHL